MALPAIAELSRTVAELQANRQAHEEVITEIGDVFAQLGINVSAAVERGPRPGKRKLVRPKAAKPVIANKRPGRPKKKTASNKVATPGRPALP